MQSDAAVANTAGSQTPCWLTQRRVLPAENIPWLSLLIKGMLSKNRFISELNKPRTTIFLLTFYKGIFFKRKIDSALTIAQSGVEFSELKFYAKMKLFAKLTVNQWVQFMRRKKPLKILWHGLFKWCFIQSWERGGEFGRKERMQLRRCPGGQNIVQVWLVHIV